MTMNGEAVRERVGDHLDPALVTLEENVRGARRAIRHGRHAVEDFAEGSALQVRRRPLVSVALAGTAGALAGCLLGIAVGWQAHGRTARR